jgi:hypothetical protein
MNTQTQNPETPRATMHEVVMKKDELISVLLENKAKHDVILAAAIEGYWDTAQKTVENKKSQFDTFFGEYQEDVQKEFARTFDKIAKKQALPSSISLRSTNIDYHLGLSYPQDHGADYERAIRMMKSSVFDEVKLSVDEFSQYVLNDWSWKSQFVASNSFYVDATRSKYSSSTGLFIANNANAFARINIMASGCAAF